jgi:hypothetical protein
VWWPTEEGVDGEIVGVIGAELIDQIIRGAICFHRTPAAGNDLKITTVSVKPFSHSYDGMHGDAGTAGMLSVRRSGCCARRDDQPPGAPSTHL